MSSTSTDAAPNRAPHLKADFLASLVVFLVALPLCIGIAVAVGVDPARALITGIIGGIFVGMFAGSPLQVSGPAAGLFVIVADMLAQGRADFVAKNGESMSGSALEAGSVEHSLVLLGAAVFLAGAMQFVAGRLKLGQWFRAVSPSVIKGMLAGIGILILISQFHVMLDHKAMWGDSPAQGALQYIATIPEAIGKCFSADTTINHHLAALIGIIAITIFVVWPKVAPQKLRFLPAALIGILAATAITAFAQVDIERLVVASNVFAEVTLPSSSWLEVFLNPIVLTGALVIALVASAETLLCATAVDQMHNGPRTDYDKELSAQGVGNLLCGLVGALPMTGVIVRSSANVASGAKTRLSTIMHGCWLLLFVAAIPFVLAYIPKAALGALLVYTGFKLVNIQDIKKLWKTSRSEVAIYFVTVGTIVSTDLLTGVITGIVLSALKLLTQMSSLRIDSNAPCGDGKQCLHLSGAATFISLPRLARELEQVPHGVELQVDFEHLTYIDHACLDLLMSWAKQHEGTGGHLVIDWDGLKGRFSTERNRVPAYSIDNDGHKAAAKPTKKLSA